MIKENDCVKLEYDAYEAENNRLFDTTNNDTAKKHGLEQQEKEYKPIQIIAGKGFIVKGLDESLIGKKKGDKYEIKIPVEKGFGKWDTKLTENIRTNVFLEKNINPAKGTFVNIDGRMAKIVFASNRMVKVDYNHPLSGKDLIYKVRILDESNDEKSVIDCMISNLLSDEFKAKIDGKSVKISGKMEIPKEFLDLISKELKEILKKDYELSFEKD